MSAVLIGCTIHDAAEIFRSVFLGPSQGAMRYASLRLQVVGPFSPPPSHKRASVYHYATKSKREFLLKMKRGAGDGTRKNKAFFTCTTEQATATCVAGMRLAPVCCSDLLNKELSSEEVASLLDETLQLSKGAVDAGSAQQMAQSV